MSIVNFQVYQIYFDALSKSKIDSGFIPYNNTGKNCHNYENDIIKDVYLSHRKEWINKDYVGVLSWRFFDKSHLTALEFYKKIIATGSPVVSVKLGSNYRNCSHPYSRKQYPQILELCRVADDHSLFDFKLLNRPIKNQIWCNYWVATPEVFELYCSKYLIKTMDFFANNKNKEVKDAYNLTLKHRDNKQTFAMTFFLEGLFSLFLQEEKIDVSQIA